MLNLNIFEAIGIVFIAQSTIYAFHLLFRNKRPSDVLLLLFLLVLILTIFNLFIRNRQLVADFPYLYYEYMALLGPLQYMYVRSVIRSDFRFQKKNLLHLIGLLYLLLLRVIFSQSEQGSLVFEKVIAVQLIISSYCYLFLSIREISKYHKVVLETQSNFHLHNLKWLTYELVILGFYFTSLVIEAILNFYDVGIVYEIIILIAFLSLLAFINVLTYKSLRSPLVISGVSESEKRNYESTRKRYAKSRLATYESSSHYQKLLNMLKQNKPYIKNDLNLSQLANLTDLSPTTLSQVINENARMNFNDFINYYRIEEAKSLLESSNDSLIKQIMYESGFNSTSTFNEVFKKHTGLSPSDYRTNFQESLPKL